ncbi:MAG: hypothetical protein ACJLTB_14010 [Algoriphagus aquaeductus]|uniref:hypothetical protein n=1 Tax=Algoriphagus TaxID=246875 RepID=UPI00258558F7|nr:hypothetical protein [Algoriphagus sp.]
MEKKIIILVSFCFTAFVCSLFFDILSKNGSILISSISQVYAQDEEFEESGPGKTEWYYYDCPYNTGKYCSSVQSTESCGKSRQKPIGAC